MSKVFIILYLLSIQFFFVHISTYIPVWLLSFFALRVYLFHVCSYNVLLSSHHTLFAIQIRILSFYSLPSPRRVKFYFICPTFYRYTNVGTAIVAVSNCVHDSESLRIKRNTSSFMVISLNCSLTLPMKRNDCEESFEFFGVERA